MKIQYFKCKLLTDVVLSASTATEGNMSTLDYIPGSNFLGIVAAQLYEELNKEAASKEINVHDKEAYKVFHTDKVAFGDANYAVDHAKTYPIPFALSYDKQAATFPAEKIWVHHVLEKNEIEPIKKEGSEDRIQRKQQRTGYFDANHNYLDKVQRKFMLKSAQDRAKRRSKDQAMFGFESMLKGQCFIFSLSFEDSIHDNLQEKIIKALVGKRRIGKSRTAQYGQVTIEAIEAPKVFKSNTNDSKRLIIYAESNLCFLNEFGQASFQPTAKDFGVDGEIIWSACQIRSHSYTPWNGYRKTRDIERDCIARGSVIVIELDHLVDVNQLPKRVGGYQAEGLGCVLYNPRFLDAEVTTGLWKTSLQKHERKSEQLKPVAISSDLGKFLRQRKTQALMDLQLSQAVQDALVEHGGTFAAVSPSQWGVIRTMAVQADKQKTARGAQLNKLREDLFGKDIHVREGNEGFIVNGVAADANWRKGKRGEKLQSLINKNEKFMPAFLAKFASEMAKFNKQKN